MDEKCKKCGQTLRRLMLLAMLKDAGAKCSPGEECSEGGDHDFDAVGAQSTPLEKKTSNGD